MYRKAPRRISFVKPDCRGQRDERIPVVIEHEGEAWGAYCPDLPGVGVVGDTREDVEHLIREAISFHLDGLRQAGDPIPEPTAVGTTLVQVPAA